jgi:hypothetical protein
MRAPGAQRAKCLCNTAGTNSHEIDRATPYSTPPPHPSRSEPEAQSSDGRDTGRGWDTYPHLFRTPKFRFEFRFPRDMLGMFQGPGWSLS